MPVQKRPQLLKALEQNHSAFVHFDPRQADFSSPVANMYAAHMCIQMGYDLPIPMVGFTTAADGFTVTLSFNRKPSKLFVPWGAVFAVVGSDGNASYRWPESMDPFVRACAEATPDAEIDKNVIHVDFKRRKRM